MREKEGGEIRQKDYKDIIKWKRGFHLLFQAEKRGPLD
ncbi:hypothetical protein B4123_2149 [Bacillus paralicheniformis]|uniref:Uncharacterized protein n=1 Tax=Bacillus paralicheniformis TaxID=1648923 RepID=A0A6I7U3Z0_9BACI|nr:hypothetical protein SC10_B2orf01561 [Bacillus paralicheniformis]OLF89275.1 hypothetical protein B4121_3668 [Bacillus paralicheniformis]OLG06353.1 hypothetical protein B4125_0534 [Bacillus paralicheniformis]OLG11434.1 hypothetical protein B4123_2149 [Bacillus paralicheniformis]TWJ41319.1 hypothetical protein CHCC5027_1297 [Bacillus paralicheniformis]